MDGGTTGIPAIYNLHAQEASRDGGDLVREDKVVPDTNIDVGMDGGATEASLMRRLPAQEASRSGDGAVQQDNVVPNINMDVRMDGATIGTPAVCNLHA